MDVSDDVPTRREAAVAILEVGNVADLDRLLTPHGPERAGFDRDGVRARVDCDPTCGRAQEEDLTGDGGSRDEALVLDPYLRSEGVERRRDRDEAHGTSIPRVDYFLKTTTLASLKVPAAHI